MTAFGNNLKILGCNLSFQLGPNRDCHSNFNSSVNHTTSGSSSTAAALDSILAGFAGKPRRPLARMTFDHDLEIHEQFRNDRYIYRGRKSLVVPGKGPSAPNPAHPPPLPLSRQPSRQLSAPRLLTLEELTKSLKSTLNTLSLILIYLGISLPTYVAAAVYVGCSSETEGVAAESCDPLHNYIVIFTSMTFVGHILFPISWFMQDRAYARKLTQACHIMRRTE